MPRIINLIVLLLLSALAVPIHAAAADTPSQKAARTILDQMTSGTNSNTRTGPGTKPGAKPAAGSVAASPAAPSAPPTNLALIGSMESLDDKHPLGIGDLLSFRIVEDQEDPRRLVVTDSGELELPYVGRFPAVGKTCSQLALEIKKKLEEEYYYQATVILAVDQLNKSRGKIYLVGYVRLPGPLDIPSDEVFTLSKAIMRAGGFHDFADKKHIRVTRKDEAGTGGTKEYEVDVGAIIEQGKPDKDIKLEPGDLVYVPSRLFKF